MKVLHLLTAGGLGGIEILNYDFGQYSKHEQGYAFLFELGVTYERMLEAGYTVYDLSEYRPKICKERKNRIIDIAKKYDVIAVHHGDPYLKYYYSYVVKKIKHKGVAFIHSCWDETLFFPNNKIKNIYGKYLFQRAMNVSKKVIFVSKAGLESYMSVYRLKNNTEIVYNGVGVDKIEAGKNNQIAANCPIRLVYIGRLEKIKGVDYLIRALPEIRKEHDIRLTIVGNGSQINELQNLAKELFVSTIVDFKGGQSDICPYLSAGDIFVYPTICKEVFGISLVEAMAYGLLCVSNRVGGIPEILVDGKNGFMNNDISVEGLTLTIRRAICCLEKGTYSDIVQNAKETAQNFSIRNTCNRLDAIYEEIATGN